WTLPANQDALTSNVILTRANTKGIFNIVLEAGYDDTDFLSPLDTEWATGSISDGVGTLTFTYWEDNSMASPPSMVGVPQVVHLITDDIYIDITFTSWSVGGGGGGGFAYTRSTDNALSLPSENLNNDIFVYPNPATDYFKIGGLTDEAQFRVFNVLGSAVMKGNVSPSESISLNGLNAGLYLLEINSDQGTIVKRFLKE
ncbi:MAG: T9SS type A sorting domain-containing protein, partial [Bacteroidia bacterium]|nr:T9SS type A sorting domain-containing protein [Bacteroidia bacterium]